MPVTLGGSNGGRRPPQGGSAGAPQHGNYTSPPVRRAVTSSSSSSSASLRVAIQKSLPLYTASFAQQHSSQLQSLTVPVRGVPPTQRHTNSSSSSPPTPSPLSTSGSEGSRNSAAAAAVGPSSPSAKIAEAGAAAASAREAHATRKSQPVSSFSIQAAAAVAAADVGYVDNENRHMHSSTAMAPTKAAVSNSHLSGPSAGPPAALSPLPSSQQQQQSPALPLEDEVAAYTKEVQRQQILAHANDLLTFCAIGNKVTSIRQCTSSFFVLLYQRLFDCTIAGIDRSPNTAEKRRHNVTLVLEQLRQHPYPLEDIAAEEVVRLNEDHISRLIMVFVQVAEDMRRQQQLQKQQVVPSAGGQPAATGADLPANAEVRASAPAAHPSTLGASAWVPGKDGAGAGNECGLVRSSNGAYVPMGYTVAEVMPNHTALQQQQFQSVGDRGPGYPLASPANAAMLVNQHHRLGLEDFYVAPAPPLNGGHHDPSGAATPQQPQHATPNVSGAGGAALVHPYEGDESPSSVSLYLDSSAIPTDELLAEWYRNLVYPAPYTLKGEDNSVMLNSTTTMPVSEVDYGKGGLAQRGRHTRLDDDGMSTSSSSAPPLHRSPYGVRKAGVTEKTSANRKPGAQPQPTAAVKKAPSPAGWARRPSANTQRTQLNANDIVRRCQRLAEVLDAEEGRHRQAFVAQPPPMKRAVAAKTAALTTATGERSSSRAHRDLAAKVTDGDPREGLGCSDKEVRHADTSATVGAEGRLARAVATPPAQQAPPQHPSQPPRQPVWHHRLPAEPPLTRQEQDFLLHRPQQRNEAAQRDRKIERLRAARYLGDVQQLLRRRMRREYDAQMSAMRGSLKESMRTAKMEKMDLMRRVQDENERYRIAYATLMEAAANEAQVPARVMSRHTAQLADYYATSLQHSHAMCETLKREMDRRTKAELLQYAEEVSAWQQHFLL